MSGTADRIRGAATNSHPAMPSTKRAKRAAKDTPKSPRSSPAAPRTYDMTLDFAGLMGILAQSLYSEKKVFIRELVQNTHNSVRRREHREKNHRGRIDIETRPDEGTITFIDNGVGMNGDDLRAYLSRIGSSGTRDVGRNQERVSGLVGQFGIGFLSGFIVAERVEVRTRKVDDTHGWLWKNDGGQSYTMEPCDVAQPGTAVTVFTKEITDRTLIQVDSVQSVIREYADMLLVPIHVNHSTTPVNTMQMPWEKTGVISDQEREFDCQIYLHKTIRGDSIMETIPVLSEKLRTGGILYISKMRTYGVRVPRNLRIHQERMFVANDAQLLPEWAEFVSGIIDTRYLTPNAARDGFIRNAAWRTLQDELGKIVIAHLEKLRDRDRKKLSYILKWHDLGIKAACYHHDAFFAKFANLLEWRVNRGAAPARDDDLEDDSAFDGTRQAFHWRTLPEVLATLPEDGGKPKRLLCFTTTASANQYFDMANAKKVMVVDASYSFEDRLIAAYVKLAGTPPLEIVHVDRGGSSGLFDGLQSADDAVRRLAEVMSQVVHPSSGAELKVDAKRFAPPTLPAVLWNPEATRGQMEAREILDNPHAQSTLRDMAEELLRSSSRTGMRMTINAACPFIARLAQQDFRDPEILHIMLGVYNSAILYNAELLTPRTAKIFHDQFGTLLERTVEHLAERQHLKKDREALENDRRALSPRSGEPSAAQHRIVFLMTPFRGYETLENALREVLEDRWGCQLFLARDRVFNKELRGNVHDHMARADAFLAEVTAGNPNVMFELGAASSQFQHRPTILLAHPRADKGERLPADLSGIIPLEYPLDVPTLHLCNHLETELRKNQGVAVLLDDDKREHFISARKLKGWVKRLTVPEDYFPRLVDRFPTRERWNTVNAADVAKLLDGEDLEFVSLLLNEVRKGLRSNGSV